ncbi:MAG: alpha/beta fold hydrolase [Bacteroidota bacterium]|jgi:pimeloyl-ACP methyl ester carboxylesterase
MIPLLLLHGLMGSKDQFETLEKKISGDFQVISINFSGHGMAEFYFPEFSVQAFAEQIIAYIDSKGIEKINLFGYSIGGYIAVYLARYYSDRINKIITLGTKFEWNPTEAEKEVKLLDSEMLESKFPTFAEALIERHGERKWKLLLEKTSQLIIALGDEPALIENQFSNLEHSVRIIVGDRDRLVSVEESLRISRIFKNGSLSVLPETRHPFESVNEAYLAFEMKNFFI